MDEVKKAERDCLWAIMKISLFLLALNIFFWYQFLNKKMPQSIFGFGIGIFIFFLSMGTLVMLGYICGETIKRKKGEIAYKQRKREIELRMSGL